jgi:ABC-type dipeptide/oligopeptide/nickel transport system permease subunit
MSTAAPQISALPVTPNSAVGRSLWYDAYRRMRRNRVAMISFWIILFYIVMAVSAKLGIIFSKWSIVDNKNAFLPASWEHPFGTDFFGRDVLGRAANGTFTALSVGFISSGLSLFIGMTLGAVAGYFGKWIDSLITWIYTTIDSIPYILLIPSLTFVLGKSLINVYIAVGLTGWVTTCRLIRAEVMKHRDREYVLAAESQGASHARRIFLHIIPNVLHLAFVQFGLGFVAAIKIEVILSYLGVGVDASTPSWGIMIDDAKQELARPFWGNFAAATLFMFGLILAFNLFNDALREAFDPKLKNR